MATLSDLLNELVTIQEAPDEFLEEVKAYVTANGDGIYSISTEYNDFTIFKDGAVSLDQVRTEVQGQIDADLDEDEESWDYFADFMDETVPEGFLYGEGWFCVEITK